MCTARFLLASFVLNSTMISMAQQAQPMTAVALFRVEPPNTGAYMAKAKEYIPTLEKLLNEGVLLSYGMDEDVLHHPTRLNVAFWYTVTNYSNLQKAEDAIAAFQAKSPELMKAMAGLTDLSKHQDIIVRSLEGNWSKASGCSNPVSMFNQNTIKAGRQRDFVEAFRSFQKPVLEELVKSGAICFYSLDVEAVHTMRQGTSWIIIGVPNLGAADKVDAAFAEATGKLSASEGAARRQMSADLVEAGKHEDSLSRAVVFKAK